MAELGAYYITVLPSMNSFTGKVNAQLGAVGKSSANNFSNNFLATLKGSAIGTALGNLASKAGSKVVSGLDAGIRRLDTLNNYPKVMEALGYSAEEAGKSVQTISDHLIGLPSSTDQVVRLTQSIADSTDDLGLATNAALGFNDMLIAAGASTEEMTTASDVLNRVLGKQSATTAQWSSLVSVMPAQMGMVAQSMLGAGASTEDLHAALENGTVSWQDFLQAIADIDQSGIVDETGRKIAGFEEQARNMSDGVGTAIDNIDNRIARGWAAILEVVGQKNIADAINSTSDTIARFMTNVADALQYVIDKIGETNIGENLNKILTAIGDGLKTISDNAADKLKDVADALIDMIDKALQWIVDHGDLVATMLAAIAGALVGIAAAQAAATLMAVVSTLQTLLPLLAVAEGITGIANALNFVSLMGGPLAGVLGGISTALTFLAANPMVLIVGAIAAVVAAIAYFLTQTEEGKAMLQGIIDWVMSIPEMWAGFCADLQRWNEDMKNAIIEQWDEMIGNLMKNLDGIRDAIGGACDTIKTTTTGFIDSIRKTIEGFFNGIRTFISNILDNIKNFIFGILDNIEKTTGADLTGIKNIFDAVFGAIKTIVDTVLGAIATIIDTKLNIIRTTIDTVMTVIKQIFAGDFEGAKNTILGVFDSIKRGIEDKLNAAKQIVSNIIDGIKNLFNFDWSLPAPQLPHIEWHWDNIGGILDIPVFDGISWYAKGGVFNAASIIGIGESGKEAALPLNDTTYREIARGIAAESKNVGGAGASILITGNTWVIREEADIDRIADKLNQKISRERAA